MSEREGAVNMDGFSLPLSEDSDVRPLPLSEPVPAIALPTTAPAAPATTATQASGPAGPAAPPVVGDIGIVSLDRDAVGTMSTSLNLDEVLLALLEKGGSDLHLSVNAPPMIRVHGDLEPLAGYPALTGHQIQEAVYALLTDRQKQAFEENKELDLAYEMPGAARFRVNVMQQHGATGAVLRVIPWEILPLEALKMPPQLGDLAALPRGLVLVTGPTGSGKSTTLAAIIDRANRTRKGHIITIEDPIEFVHQHKNCIINQREVGADTWSFANALKHALRQDPDIILVGEMRDLETIATALTAAETGHLVFGTLHTSSAAKTIDRIIDVFPAEEKEMMRAMLSESLRAVISQALLKTKDGTGRVAAHEIMVGTPAIRNLIREAKIAQMYSAIQTGQQYGMQTLDQNLQDLVRRNVISVDEARSKAANKDNFK